MYILSIVGYQTCGIGYQKKMFLWILFGFAIWFKLCQALLNFLQSCSKHLHSSVNFIYFFVDTQNGFGFDWFYRNTQNTRMPLSQGMNFESFAYPPSDELHPDHDDIADVVQGKSDTQAQSSANGTNEGHSIIDQEFLFDCHLWRVGEQ